MRKSWWACSGSILLSLSRMVQAFDASSNSNLVMYWGQNSYGEVGSQSNLASYCQDSTTDIIILAFLSVFFDSSSGLPVVNFAGSCGGSYFENTTLLDCPTIAEDIVTCQNNGKKIFLSLGGASGSYGFDDDAQAETFAATVWDLFGGGWSNTRPFGSAVVDGFDLDIEGGSSAGYAAFVTALRTYYDEYTDKDMYISGAPQCPMPDAFLNDAMVNSYFDFYFVQFFNNYCGLDQWSANESSSFNFDAWDSFAKTGSYNTDVKVYLGVAASKTAAGTGYVDIDTLVQASESLMSTYSSFGGIMMWDASQAYNNIPDDGLNYAQLAKNGLVSSAETVITTSEAAVTETSLLSWTTIADDLTVTTTPTVTVTSSDVTTAVVASETTSTPDDGLWHTAYGTGQNGYWYSTYDDAKSETVSPALTVTGEASVISVSSIDVSQPVQTLVVTDTPTTTYPVVSVSPSTSVESSTVLTSTESTITAVPVPSSTEPSATESTSAVEQSTQSDAVQPEVLTSVYSYTSTVINSLFSEPLQIVFYTTLVTTVDVAQPTSVQSVIASSAVAASSSEASLSSTASVVALSSSAILPESSTVVATPSATETSAVWSSDSGISTSVPYVSSYTAMFSETPTSSSEEWQAESSVIPTLTVVSPDVTVTQVSIVTDGTTIVSSIFATAEVTDGGAASSVSSAAAVPTSTSVFVVQDSSTTVTSSLTFITNQPWSATVTTATSAAEATASGGVSACPVDGAPCAVHGELACDGYSYGQCVWGTWVVRQCYTGLSCQSDGSEIYCGYPGPEPVTSCSASSVTSTLSKRDHGAKHRQARRKAARSPFYDPELGKKYFPHVPVNRFALRDSIEDVADDVTASSWDDTAASPTITSSDASTTSSVGRNPTIIQGIQFGGLSGSSESITAIYQPTSTLTADTTTETDTTDSFVIRTSSQRLNSTNFVGTLYAAPLTNTPIGQSWQFVFTSDQTITKVSRGVLTSIGDNEYQITSITTEEATSYMAISLTYWGTYSSD